MNMVKLAGQILIVLSGCGLGIYLKSRLIARRRILTAMVLAVNETATQIGYISTDIKALTAALCRQSGLEILSFLVPFHEDLRCGNSPRHAADAATEGWQRGVVSAADRQMISAFFGGLGQSDRAGQLAHCALYEEQFKSAAAEAAEAQRQKGKMVLTLSMLAALALVILTF